MGEGAQALLHLKRSNPDAYRERIAEIERGVLGVPGEEGGSGGRAVVNAPRARSLDSLVANFQKLFDLDRGQAAKLSLVRLGTIYACVTLRADMISGLPLCLYRNTGEGAREHRRRRIAAPGNVRNADAARAERVESHQMLGLLKRPNEDWTGRRLLHMVEMALGLVGEAHVRAHRTSGRTPVALSYYRHGRLSVVKAAETDAARTVAGWKLDADRGTGGETLPPDEVIWFRYPDPEDPDYGALPPAGVARLGADSYRDAMVANRDIFRRGLRADAIITPGEEFGGQFSFENIGELRALIEDALKGTENNHGVSPLPYPFNVSSLAGISPKDAEFVALLDFAIEDAARAYRIPIEMVGGTRRTYQNNEAADAALWQRSLMPEACWLAEEMTARLVPLFGLDPSDYFLAFDLSDVVALQDDEDSRSMRATAQLGDGRITVNEWRAEEGLDPVPWGNAWWAPSGLAPIEGIPDGGAAEDVTEPEADAPDDLDAAPPDAEIETGTADDIRAAWARLLARVESDDDEDEGEDEGEDEDGEDEPWAYGGDEHRAALARQDDALEPHEKRLEDEMRRLFARQRESILDRLDNARSTGSRIGLGDLPKIFQRGRWIREFRTRMFPLLRGVAADGGGGAWKDIGAEGDYDPDAPAAVNAMRRQAQRFAVEVNETTWQALRESLAQGLKDGEGTPSMAERVEHVMGWRIRSSAETIARTEAHTAINTGALEAVKASGMRMVKVWLSALDSRTRDTHEDAHGQKRPLDEDFRVGTARGPAPGRMGAAEHDCNCRCTMVYERDSRLWVGDSLEGSHVSESS